jgi:hypothetical protein
VLVVSGPAAFFADSTRITERTEQESPPGAEPRMNTEIISSPGEEIKLGTSISPIPTDLTRFLAAIFANHTGVVRN